MVLGCSFYGRISARLASTHFVSKRWLLLSKSLENFCKDLAGSKAQMSENTASTLNCATTKGPPHKYKHNTTLNAVYKHLTCNFTITLSFSRYPTGNHSWGL